MQADQVARASSSLYEPEMSDGADAPGTESYRLGLAMIWYKVSNWPPPTPEIYPRQLLIERLTKLLSGLSAPIRND